MEDIINRLQILKAYCKLMNRQEQSIQWQKDIEALNEAVKGLQELMAYREAYEKMRQLPLAWEEGAGIEKCTDIIEEHLKNIDNN
jgi:hypothetical protein